MEVVFLIKRCLYFLFLILLTISFAGCVVNNDSQSTTADSTLATTEPAAQDPLLTFLDIMPNATIHEVVRCDLDANNEEDCIVLFSSDDKVKPITAGVSVCLSNSLYSAIDLAPESNLVFDSKASLTYNKDTPIISVHLKDPSNETTYLFEVEYIYNQTSQSANFKIHSQIISNGG